MAVMRQDIHQNIQVIGKKLIHGTTKISHQALVLFFFFLFNFVFLSEANYGCLYFQVIDD